MVRRVAWGLFVLLLAAAGWVAWQVHARPPLQPYADLWMPPAAAANAGRMKVTFLGVSTLLFDDGETAFITDGFFSRPPLGRVVFGRVGPDRATIAASLRRAGIGRLAAVVVMHSHYDHAMDAPEVARLTGALLVGSESTANVGRGWGLPPAQLRVVGDHATLQLGRFELELVASVHAPTGFTGGTIDAPLVPPVRATAYKEGRSYSLLVRHEGHAVLVQASAGFVPGALAGRHADVAFLGTGALGKQPAAYREQYWNETVRQVGARRVVPVHWDDFTLPLDQPLQASPLLIDDFSVVMQWLRQRCAASRVDLRLAPAWQAVDPLAGP